VSELSPEARALLESTRDGDDPSERDRARMRQRLSLAIAAAGAGAAASAAAPAVVSASAAATATKAGIGVQVAASAAAPVAATTLSAKIGVAVTVAVISVAGTGVVLKNERAAEPQAHKPVAAVVHAPRAPSRKRVAHEEPSVVSAPEPIAPPSLEAPRVVAPEPVPVARAARAPQQPSRVLAPALEALPLSLQTEIQLLSSAQAALRDGGHDRALASLAEHAARFPNGALALERDAVRAIALCSSGRMNIGRSAATELAPRIAGSPLAARLERACELEGDERDGP
jgi:hypothetical protein